ncbi:MAG TPA: DUF6807 family protein [Alphaproteobacteria bacterium]
MTAGLPSGPSSPAGAGRYGAFAVEVDPIPLPRGASAKARRLYVRCQGRTLFGLSQGQFRAYLFPVYTPAGHAVTTESPIDHPHHNSLWIGADHVHAHMPYGTGERVEEATYNFYVNETFQGRAPGRIAALDLAAEAVGSALRMAQTLEWRGPSEWGAPEGRVLAHERRTILVRPGERAHVIDILSDWQPTDWDMSVGPCRHAWFTLRVAEALREAGGGLLGADGRRGAEALDGAVLPWIDFSGPAAGGARAGIALIPHRSTAGHPWYVADWGMMAVNPFIRERRSVRRGEALSVGVRAVVHDGDPDFSELERLCAEIAGGAP